MIERTLDTTPYSQIDNAANGKIALSKFMDSPADVVTMDITMPEMDGLTCIEEILKIKHDTKILVISGLADKSTAVEAVKRGAEGFLLKPFEEDDLAEAMKDLFE